MFKYLPKWWNFARTGHTGGEILVKKVIPEVHGGLHPQCEDFFGAADPPAMTCPSDETCSGTILKHVIDLRKGVHH